ncbi:hypothetical protein ACFSBG_08390 [Georgenia yuyongxinii]|nr:hypothetical protein [Georgenia yuyongxinii]
MEIADSAGGLTQYVSLHDAAIDFNLHPLQDKDDAVKVVIDVHP